MILLAGPLAGAAAAQPSDVSLPPVEIGAAFSYDDTTHAPSTPPRGAGSIFAVNGNVTDHVAVAGELASSRRMRSIAAGPRVSTGYYHEANSDGRFFASALIGRHDGGNAPPGTMIQVGAGADVLVAPRGVSLHWAIDYLFTPGSREDLSGARFSVGIVVGPRKRT